MSVRQTLSLPLKNLREAAGLSRADAANLLTERLNQAITPDYLRTVEYRGTRVYDWIEAMASIYDRPVTTVAEAAKLRR